jgi:hypothetical protein
VLTSLPFATTYPTFHNCTFLKDITKNSPGVARQGRDPV